jgi:hypothetical protein
MLLSENGSTGAAGVAIVVARSTDSGQTWSQLGNPVVNRITATTALDDKEFMAIDNTSGQAHSFPGRIYVVWDEGNVERVAYSDDAVTWSTVLLPSGTSAIAGNLAIAADGTVYVIWTRYNVETIVFSKSINGGATWTAPAVIATNALQSFGSNNKPPVQNSRGINGFASIDVDRNSASAFFGNIYVGYTDFPAGTNSGTDLNTYIVRSTNGGTSWSTRVKANDDSWGASQIFPWLGVDQSDGTVNVSWVDTRIDPLNRKTQAVYARSTDGGATFEANIPLDDNGPQWRNNVNYSDENTADNPNYNGNQYGDYTGLAAANRQVHSLWTDSRAFFPVADTQSPTRREDNGTSTITNCSAPAVVSSPAVNSSTTPSVAVTWAAPSGWGTNATNGTYSVYRNTTPAFPAGAALASGLTSTSYVDATGIGGTTYYYFVRARNNCPGTVLTPMTSDSGASSPVIYGSAGTATGALQGTVTAAGNGNPLGNVVVFAGSLSATTNGSGFYQIPAVNAGTYTVSASQTGYSGASVNGVVVSSGATKVQDLALTPNGGSNCFTDTSFADFSAGSGTNTDVAGSPGNVKLFSPSGEAVDQTNTAFTAINTTPTSTTWGGQTFLAGKTGNLTTVAVGLGLNSGSTGTVTVEIRNTSGTNPGATILASGTLGPVTNSTGTVATYSTTFGSPAAVVSGTSYAVVIKGGTGSVYIVTSGNTYANGQYFSTADSGSTWAGQTADMTFTTYVTPATSYPTSGNFISSTKDSGAVAGTTPVWTTLSWTNATLPSVTNIQFQAAASNSPSGPFNFVGPDNTAATFFTNGGSLALFNGNRYLKYKASFTTNNTSNTPTLNDVTVCVSDLVPPILSSASSRKTHSAAGVFDLPLSLTGRSVEPRTGAGGHTIVLNFDKAVTSGTASVTAGTATPGAPSFSGSSMIVPLTGVTDQQAVTVQVNNVTGPGAAVLPSASITIGFLVGDVNGGDGVVNSADATVVRNRSGATLDNTNFPSDVNLSGTINSGDATIVRNNSSHFLP